MSTLRTWIAGLPSWVWPSAALATGAVLVWQGRLVVAGLLAAIAVAFGLCLVLLLLWALVGMARPGRHVSLDGPRAVAAHLRHEAAQRAGQARRVVGQAPWRRPQQVLTEVAEQVNGQVVELPDGTAAVRTVEVRLHPDTIAALDAWMPIEDVARRWARNYATVNTRLPSDTGKVSVLIITDDQIPVNRARVASTFRNPDHPDAVALASARLTGPRLDPSRGIDTVLRVDQPPAHGEPAPPRPAGPPQDGGTRMGPGGTVRMPANPQAADSRGTQVLPPTGTRPAATSLDALLLIPVHPGTGRPTGQDPLTVHGPRAKVGRATDRDVQLANTHVSRWHAEIKRLSSGWVITDQQSTRGTYLNLTPIEPQIPGNPLEPWRPDFV